MVARFWALVVMALGLGIVPAQAQFNFLPEIRGGVMAGGIDDGAELFSSERISHGTPERANTNLGVRLGWRF